MKIKNWKILWILTLISWIGMVHASPSAEIDASSQGAVCDSVSSSMKRIAEARDAKKDYTEALQVELDKWEKAGFSEKLFPKVISVIKYNAALTWKYSFLSPSDVYTEFYLICMKPKEKGEKYGI